MGNQKNKNIINDIMEIVKPVLVQWKIQEKVVADVYVLVMTQTRGK